MTSLYKGLYIQRLENGNIHNVQVVDTGGISIGLEPGVYIERDIKPPIDNLMELSEYSELRRIHKKENKYPPIQTRDQIELLKIGYIKEITKPIENEPNKLAIVGYEITKEGMQALGL